MKSKLLLLTASLVVVVALLGQGLGNPAPTAAQTGGSYDLTWNTIDGGGGTSTGGAYSLSGTIGQPDAGIQIGGAYTLNGGFWAAFEQLVSQLKVYLPLIMR